MAQEEYTLNLTEEQYTLVLNVPQRASESSIISSRSQNAIDAVSVALFSGFKGDKGDKGDKGEPGVGSSATRIDYGLSDAWSINHNYGYYPIVNAYTTGGVALIGTVVHLNANQINITFDEPVAGFVTIS